MLQNFFDFLALIFKPGNRSLEDQPSRIFELDFDLLEPDKNNRKPGQNYYSYSRAIKGLQESPVQLLSVVGGHLTLLNRYRASISSRQRHLDVSCQYGLPAIREVYLSFQKKEEFPESEHRRLALVVSIDVVKGLSTGYKLLLLHYYSLSDRKFNLNKERVQMLGFRIMELIYMEQYLGALRYQKLSEHTWRDCNQLFFALHEISYVKNKFLFSANMNKLAGQTRKSAGSSKTVDYSNIQQLYLLIQLMGIMDIISWPFPMVYKMESYLYNLCEKIKIKSDHGRELEQGNLIVYNEQICPPLFSRLDSGSKPAVLLDTADFEHAMRVTYDELVAENLNQNMHDGVDLSLDLFDEQNLLNKMLNKLHYLSRAEPRKYINQYSDLQLFFGFKECFQFIRDMSDSDYDLLNKDFSLRKTLAQKTSLIVTETDVKNDQRWYVINESQGGVHLRLKETKSTPSMFIGQIVVANLQHDGKNKYDVGYVSRIHRGRDSDVEITIIKLGAYADCVGLQDEQLKKQGNLAPSILVNSYSGDQILLLYNKQYVNLGSDLSLLWKNESQAVQLGPRRLKMPEFIGYQISD